MGTSVRRDDAGTVLRFSEWLLATPHAFIIKIILIMYILYIYIYIYLFMIYIYIYAYLEYLVSAIRYPSSLMYHSYTLLV